MERLIKRPSGVWKHWDHRCFRKSNDPSVRGVFHGPKVALVSLLCSIIVWDYKRWVVAALSLLSIGQWVLVFMGTWITGAYDLSPSTLPSRLARRNRQMESPPWRMRPHRLRRRIYASDGSLLDLQYVMVRGDG
jgi:hypothetical protein